MPFRCQIQIRSGNKATGGRFKITSVFRILFDARSTVDGKALSAMKAVHRPMYDLSQTQKFEFLLENFRRLRRHTLRFETAKHSKSAFESA